MGALCKHLARVRQFDHQRQCRPSKLMASHPNSVTPPETRSVRVMKPLYSVPRDLPLSNFWMATAGEKGRKNIFLVAVTF